MFGICVGSESQLSTTCNQIKDWLFEISAPRLHGFGCPDTLSIIVTRGEIARWLLIVPHILQQSSLRSTIKVWHWCSSAKQNIFGWLSSIWRNWYVSMFFGKHKFFPELRNVAAARVKWQEIQVLFFVTHLFNTVSFETLSPKFQTRTISNGRHLSVSSVSFSRRILWTFFVNGVVVLWCLGCCQESCILESVCANLDKGSSRREHPRHEESTQDWPCFVADRSPAYGFCSDDSPLWNNDAAPAQNWTGHTKFSVVAKEHQEI